MDDVKREIERVWGDIDDFEEYGFEYFAFVIEKDLDDMAAEGWDNEECLEEVADIAINSIRMLMVEGGDPQDRILDRLQNHENKGVNHLEQKKIQEFKS